MLTRDAAGDLHRAGAVRDDRRASWNAGGRPRRTEPAAGGRAMKRMHCCGTRRLAARPAAPWARTTSGRRSPCPAQFRGAPRRAADPAASIADTKWQDLFPDPTSEPDGRRRRWQHNFDLRIAAERVEEARAQLGITRANQYPFLDAQAGFTGRAAPRVGSNTFVPAGHEAEQSPTPRWARRFPGSWTSGAACAV